MKEQKPQLSLYRAKMRSCSERIEALWPFLMGRTIHEMFGKWQIITHIYNPIVAAEAWGGKGLRQLVPQGEAGPEPSPSDTAHSSWWSWKWAL